MNDQPERLKIRRDTIWPTPAERAETPEGHYILGNPEEGTITLANLTQAEYDHFVGAVRKAVGAKTPTRYEKVLAGVGKLGWTMVGVAASIYLIAFLLHHARNL